MVDKDGRVVGNKPNVVRSTHPDLLTAVVATLPLFRYEPAKKNGVPVAQLVSYATGMQVGVVQVGSTQSSSRRPSAPTC